MEDGEYGGNVGYGGAKMVAQFQPGFKKDVCTNWHCRGPLPQTMSSVTTETYCEP